MNENEKKLLEKALIKTMKKSLRTSPKQLQRAHNAGYGTVGAYRIASGYKLGGKIATWIAGKPMTTVEKQQTQEAFEQYGNYAALDYDLKHSENQTLAFQDRSEMKGNIETRNNMKLYDEIWNRFETYTEDTRREITVQRPGENQEDVLALARAKASMTLRGEVEKDVKQNPGKYGSVQGSKWVIHDEYRKLKEAVSSKLDESANASTKVKIQGACRQESQLWKNSGEQIGRTRTEETEKTEKKKR